MEEVTRIDQLSNQRQPPSILLLPETASLRRKSALWWARDRAADHRKTVYPKKTCHDIVICPENCTTNTCEQHMVPNCWCP